MTFKEYVYISAMLKMDQEKALNHIRDLTSRPDLVLAEQEISAIFWNWFFEISSDGVSSWNSLVAANDYETLQAMLLDLQSVICNGFKTAAGDLVQLDGPEWSVRVFDVYTAVFSDYIGNVIPSLIPSARSFFHPVDLDEGIED